ncbi:uncharacterized protein LOC117640547 [Thrips palmi]|uniref:Uncharacterized protein LOC117640547 n=1 Tax=Thrips palmi TaxID=161013 RepID=A0A6P8YG85_THRPL|nr:uncharacterized protein LOC117640547 [Thrips palmi]
MRACVRCVPPRAPDVAVLLFAVVVALLIALEAPAVHAAGSGPCQHRAKRTTEGTSSTSPTAPSSPVDAIATTGFATSPGVADDVRQDVPADDVVPDVLVDTASTSITTLQPASTAAGLSADTMAAPSGGDAQHFDDAVPPAAPQAHPDGPARVPVESTATTETRQGASLEPAPTAVSVTVDDNVLVGDQAASLAADDYAVTAPHKRHPSPAPPAARSPPAVAASTTSRAARLQEERARRLEKIQRDLLERKHRRASRITTTTEPPAHYDDDDLNHGLDDDLEDLLREDDGDLDEPEEAPQDKRPSRPGQRGQDPKQKQDKAGGDHRHAAPPLDKHEDAVGGRASHRADPEGKQGRRKDGRRQDGHGHGQDGHGHAQDGHGGQTRASRRGQDQDRRKAARRRDSDEDPSIEDNSLTDGSWDDAHGHDADLGDWGGLVCPRSGEVSLLSRQCQTDRDCKGVGEQCCKDRLGLRRCVLGVAPTMPDIPHEPFFGVVARICPNPVDTLVEPWSITNCTNDDDCWPRVCCVDGPYAYCRTPQLEWEKLPGQRFVAPLRLLMSYLQCTPPPPPVFDLFPKSCRNTLDCFPNLCCQERGRKVCRPPKRSLLALLATIGQGAGYFTSQQMRHH